MVDGDHVKLHYFATELIMHLVCWYSVAGPDSMAWLVGFQRFSQLVSLQWGKVGTMTSMPTPSLTQQFVHWCTRAIREIKQQVRCTLAEEHIPHSEHRWPRQRSTVYAHKPLGHVQDWLDLLSLLQCRKANGAKLATDKKRLIINIYTRGLLKWIFFTRKATKVKIFDSSVNALHCPGRHSMQSYAFKSWTIAQMLDRLQDFKAKDGKHG